MESAVKNNDSTTCLPHNEKTVDFSQWSSTPPNVMDLSLMVSKTTAIDPAPSDGDAMCIFCQLCGHSVKSNKMLTHMTVHFLQLSQNFSPEDFSLFPEKQQKFRSPLELLRGNIMRPNQLNCLRDTAKNVLSNHLGPHITEDSVDAFLALALELVAQSPTLYQQTYDRIQKDWFQLDRLHYQQLTAQSLCSNCKPVLHFALGTTHSLHDQLTHAPLRGLDNSQIVNILDSMLDKTNNSAESRESVDNSIHEKSFISVGSYDSHPAVRLMKAAASQNTIQTDPRGVSSLHCSKLSPPAIGVTSDELPAAMEVSSFIDSNPAGSEDGLNNMLTAFSSLQRNLIPFNGEKLYLSTPSLKKSKVLSDLFSPSLLSGLVFAPHSPRLTLDTTGSNESTMTLTSDKMTSGISTPMVPQRRSRTRLSEAQLAVLRSYFDINNSPSEEKIMEICTKTGLPGKVVKHWFRNTLFKERQRTKDNPYNFSVPPSTSIDLEEYEKTGRVEVRPAVVNSLPTSRYEDILGPVESNNHAIIKGEKSSPGADKPQGEVQSQAIHEGPHSGIHQDDQTELDRMEFLKRYLGNRSFAGTPAEVIGPNPPKRSRCSSVGSIGVEYDSLKPSSQVFFLLKFTLFSLFATTALKSEAEIAHFCQI